MRHAEGASGLCSIAKIVVMLQTGLIPANLHYKDTAFSLNSIRTGALKVVVENTAWKGGYIGVNSFGFGGVNTHVILKPWGKGARHRSVDSCLTEPRLVLFSGRNESGVMKALQNILDSKNLNLFALANELNKAPSPVSTVRGYGVLQPSAAEPEGASEERQPILQVQIVSATPSPPVWFVLNGIGSQWIGMGRDLLRFPVFAASIQRSAKTLLEKFDFDLLALLNTNEVAAYDSPINCFVGITACQLGLVDVLSALGIRPDGFLGHSAGEMACAYIDECLTAEETIICAYLRGESLTRAKGKDTGEPEYFVNNFLSPVLFYEGLQHVPENAVVVEIGPSGLLRGLVKRACPTATVIPLQARDSCGSYVDLLTAFGKLYAARVSFNANELAIGPPPVFPVPANTPFISSLVESVWNHSTSWEVPFFGMNGELQTARFEVDVSTEADSFLTGHTIQGRVLYPATGYLFLVWRHFAQTRQLPYEECPVVFENVRFNRVTVLRKRDKVEFWIHISEISGAFEVKEGGAIVATGFIRSPDSSPGARETRLDDACFARIEQRELVRFRDGGKQLHLEQSHVYRRHRLVGMEYSGLFLGIIKCDRDFSAFCVGWKRNWIAFLDAFLQATKDPGGLRIPAWVQTSIGKLVLDPVQFLQYIANNQVPDGEPSVLVWHEKALGIVKTHGIEMHWSDTAKVNSSNVPVQPTLLSTRFRIT